MSVLTRSCRWPLGLLAGAILSLTSITPSSADAPLYFKRAEVEAEAQRLRAAGQQVEVRTEPLRRTLNTVHLTYFQTRAAAELAAEKLRQYDVDAYVILPRERFGFAVSAGSFTKRSSAENRVDSLNELGFKNTRIRQQSGRLLAYRLEYTGKALAQQPGALTPPAKAATSEEATEFTFADPSASRADGDVLTFGAVADSGSGAASAPPKTLEWRVDRLGLETGILNSTAHDVKGSHYAELATSLRWRASDALDVQLGVRLDGYSQNGYPSFTEADAELEETFVRWRGDDSRLTLGAQTVVWGRVDELSPTNLLLRQDMTRYTLGDLSNRYRSQAALRYEFFSGSHKFDALALPRFEEGALPEQDSIWHPIDRRRGRIQGFEANPLLAALLSEARIDDDFEGKRDAGGGLRYSYSGEGFDLGATTLYGRASQPYYRFNSQVRGALLGGATPEQALAASSAPLLQAEYPLTRQGSVDLAFSAWDATWRGELAYNSDTPVTTPTLGFDTVPSLSWAAGVELFPGDGNDRLTIQLNGRHLRTDQPLADLSDLYVVSGELENGFAQERWRLRTRLLASFADGKHDLYFNPELAWRYFEPSEFYLGGHWFAGDERLPSGYHDEHDLITLGWRTQF